MKSWMTRAITGILLFGSISPARAQDQQYKDDDLAVLRTAAEVGDANAQFALGNHYLRGRGVEQDYGQAMAYFRKAADRGLTPAQNQLGTMYEQGFGVPQDALKALNCYRQAADQGYALAQYNLGLLFENGRGARIDYKQALDWFQKAADQGQPDAEEKVGFYYQRGLVVPQIFARAMDWYQKAAGHGSAAAENAIGHLFQFGLGVRQDYGQALAWYDKAAEHGNSDAQSNIGYMYENGQGVERDYAQALAWFYKSANQGNSIGQNNIGWMYELGQGVSIDYGQALAWYRAAADQGYRTAIENVERLTEKLQTGDQAQWEAVRASAQQNGNGQSERRSQIVKLRREIAELEFDARQEDNLAAQLEQPSEGAAAPVVDTFNAIGAAKFRMEAEKYRYEAGRLREELAEFDDRAVNGSPTDRPMVRSIPTADGYPDAIVDGAIEHEGSGRVFHRGRQQEEPTARRQRPLQPIENPSSLRDECTEGWKIGTFRITASGNDLLGEYTDIAAIVVDETGNPALRGRFLSLGKGNASDLPVYYGFDGTATERLLPRHVVTIPIRVPKDPSQAASVLLTVRYCKIE